MPEKNSIVARFVRLKKTDLYALGDAEADTVRDHSSRRDALAERQDLDLVHFVREKRREENEF